MLISLLNLDLRLLFNLYPTRLIRNGARSELGDFRVQSYEAIHKWFSIVQLTLTFLYWQRYQAYERGQPILSIAQVIHRHQATHARDILITACQQAIDEGDLEAVVERFTTTTQAAA